METRTVEQVKIYKLTLNEMTMGHIEECKVIAISYDAGRLVDWIEGEKADEYWHDGRWGKTFKKDSHLEWFNPPDNYNQSNHWGQGIDSEWVNMDIIEGIKANNPGIYIVE